MANTFEPIKIDISVEGTNQAVKDIELITTQLEKLQSVSKSLTNVMKTTFDFSTKNINKSSQKNYLNTGTINNIKNANKSYSKSVNKVNDSIKKASSSTSIFNKGTLKLGISLFTMKKAIDYLSDAMDESASWVENLNVMEVAFGKLSSKAYQFTKTLSEGFGLDANEILQYVSLFQQMASAMGQTTETAYMMSTALTSLGVDVASLYNKDIGVTMEALRSAIAGQVKPVRQFGFDITSYSIDSLLEQIEGFENITSRALSQSQKQLARTILLLQQSKNAWGDLGKTLNTYSNQQKILSAQFTNLKRALGDLFVGTEERVGIATKALYVINGVLMSIVSIIRTFIPEASSSGFNDVKNDVDDTTESIEELESATKGALASFDQFNTLSSGSGDGDIGITSALELKLAEEYNKYLEQWNKRMENITSKAHDIRDAIMGWLGFTKEVTTETDEYGNKLDTVNFVLKDGITNLSLIKDIVKTLIVFGIAKYITNITKSLIALIPTIISTGKATMQVNKILTTGIIFGLVSLIDALDSGNKKMIYFSIGVTTASLALTLFAHRAAIAKTLQTLGIVLKMLTGLFGTLHTSIMSCFTGLVMLTGAIAIFSFMDEFSAKAKVLIGIIGTLTAAVVAGAAAWLAYHGAMTLGVAVPTIVGSIALGVASITALIKGIKQYAKGGIPDEGQLFIANEAGPELVGNIGGRTAVANNDMIVSAIEMASFRGVSRAMSTSGTNNTINFSFNGVNSSELARAIAQPMANELKRQGYKISKI